MAESTGNEAMDTIIEENKHLKEAFKNTINQLALRNDSLDNLIEKLWKINELHLKYYRAEIGIDEFHTQLRAILKE